MVSALLKVAVELLLSPSALAATQKGLSESDTRQIAKAAVII